MPLSGNQRRTSARRPVYEAPRIVEEMPLALWPGAKRPVESAPAAPPRVDPISFARSKLPTAGWSHCPYLGLRVAPDIVELWPSPMHACFAAGLVGLTGGLQGDELPLDTQVEVCLTPSGQRSCRRYAAAMVRDVLSGAAVVPAVEATRPGGIVPSVGPE